VCVCVCVCVIIIIIIIIKRQLISRRNMPEDITRARSLMLMLCHVVVGLLLMLVITQNHQVVRCQVTARFRVHICMWVSDTAWRLCVFSGCCRGMKRSLTIRVWWNWRLPLLNSRSVWVPVMFMSILKLLNTEWSMECVREACHRCHASASCSTAQALWGPLSK